MNDFPYRQVHLDFHTYGNVPKVGNRFSKENFQEALKIAHLDSITVFAKCNQGYCYYPTEVGMMHPGLDFDLTAAMIDAAHEIGVRAPVYINAGLSQAQAPSHPEWWSYRSAPKSEGGSASWGGDFTLLCLNNESYTRHLFALTEEVCRRYPALDGLFFDIVLIGETCYCDECLRGMKEMGLDWKKPADAKLYYTLQRKKFMAKCREILLRYHPNATVFFNSGGANHYRPEYHEDSTHFEMEDLPTAWGGYDKLPLRAKYFSRTGKPYLAMTGKFHLNWGEFGGYKCKEALKYEVALMALYGAGCSVGDHLHPDGKMERQTYENVGFAYEYLEKIAPFCYGGDSTARLGVYLSPNKEESQGIAQLLLEMQVDFDVVFQDEYDRFDAVIVPDGVVLEGKAKEALEAYLAGGGKLLFFGESLVKDGAFQISVGAEYLGKPPMDCDYILCPEGENFGLPKSPLLSYYCGHQIRATEGETFAWSLHPYFSKEAQVFCEARQVPFDREGEKHPVAVKYKNVVYSAHPLATVYHKYGSLYHKKYFSLLLEKLGYRGSFEIRGLGSAGRVTMIRQEKKSRYCLNLTYAIPSKKGVAEVIEDLPPVFDVEILLNVKEKVTKAYCGVSGEPLPLEVSRERVRVILPRLHCHESIVFEYEK